jgi:hypothetical protein
MKRIALSILLATLVFTACQEEDDEQVAPVVNINEESKGDKITFSIPHNEFIFETTDTFAIISGGVPPYLITSTQGIYSSYISKDTVFFRFPSSGLTIRRLVIEDSRGYNQAELSFVSTPTVLTYSVLDVNGQSSEFYLMGYDQVDRDSTAFLFENSSVLFNLKTQKVTFTSTYADVLLFSFNKNSPNQLDSIYFSDYGTSLPWDPNQIDPRYAKAFNQFGNMSSVYMKTGYLNLPESISFNLFVNDSNDSTILNIKAKNLLLD